jgi:peptide chain release factor subunit 3
LGHDTSKSEYFARRARRHCPEALSVECVRAFDANLTCQRTISLCKQKNKSEPKELPAGKILKKHLNVVFCGHVDAGKSTISGHIMYLTGQVDERTMEKYEREAKAKHRESWKFAWCMDTTDEERAKGKTQECGRGTFETEHKNYTILDAPGHKNFVPHMIGGASQADVAVLVISVRKGEFEAGFDRGGQSREHAVLAKTAGVKTLIMGINKMDDPSVCLEGGLWDEERYEEVKGILLPFLKQTGFSEKDVFFMPISGFTGANLKDRVDTKVCPWYGGPSLLEFLDGLQPSARFYDMPLRFPIADKYKDMGTCVMGKLEAGSIRKGESLIVLPNKTNVTVEDIFIDHGEEQVSLAGKPFVHDLLCSALLPRIADTRDSRQPSSQPLYERGMERSRLF